jgi:hypothetical protein
MFDPSTEPSTPDHESSSGCDDLTKRPHSWLARSEGKLAKSWWQNDTSECRRRVGRARVRFCFDFMLFKRRARVEPCEHKMGGDFIREWVRSGAGYRGLVRRVEAWGFI